MIHPVTSARLRVLAMAVVAVSLLQSGMAQAQNNISTVAGNGTPGFSGDGGPATSASISSAHGVAVDAAGNRYIADTGNYRIRKVTPAGVISTVAGNGSSGFSGDGGPATSAGIGVVYKLAVDAGGNLFLADYGNARIRMVTAGGAISTVAGNGSRLFSGDGGPATSAGLRPMGIAVDAAGNIFFADAGNNRIRRITAAGVISTVAGDGSVGFSGDGGPATSASMDLPNDVAVDAAGSLYISDCFNHRIRKVTASGTISTVAGNGSSGYNGDGGAATAAALWNPVDIELDAGGSLYIADTNNLRIRKVTAAGVISTFAGNGNQGFSGDGGPATSAQLSGPDGLAIAGGSLYIADTFNHRLRAVSLFPTCADEGYTGTRLSMCRQVCEIDQSPARLTSLIRLYMANYRDTPPCAQ